MSCKFNPENPFKDKQTQSKTLNIKNREVGILCSINIIMKVQRIKCLKLFSFLESGLAKTNNEGIFMAQLQDLFRRHAVVKILDFLTLYNTFEYTRTDIANETGISRRTLYEVWPILEKFDLVKITKTSGRIKFFKLNTQNPISKELIILTDKIAFFSQ